MGRPDLRRLLDASSELLCVTDAGWVVAFANASWERVLGYPPASLRGGSLRPLIQPDDLSTAEALAAGELGEDQRVIRLLAADGSFHAVRAHILRGQGGELQWALRLIWEIEAVEEEVRETHHRLRSLVERALDAFFIKDLDGRYLFINPQGAAYLGASVDEVLGRTDEAFFGPDSAADVRRVDREVIESGKPITYQPTRDDFDMPRSFLTTKYPYTDRFGKLAGVMGVSHDVSEWTKAQAAARRSDASFRRLVEASPDLVVVHRAGEVVYANPATLRGLGYSAVEELAGLDLLDLVRPGDRDRVQMAETGEFLPVGVAPTPQEIGLQQRGGGILQVEILELELSWEGGPAQVVVARDVTERRRLEAQLAQADRLASVGTLAAGVAHEINNPLTFVIHHLERIQAGLPPVGPLIRMAAEAAAGAQRIQGIVKDMMLFARADAGLVEGSTEVHELLERAIQLGATQVRHRARLVRDFGPPAQVDTQGGRLGQVFLNLLVNAAQAIPVGKAERNEIRVRTRIEGDEVIVGISDTGSGIPEAVLPRIFEPFTTTKGVGEGTGLGLWICHGIVTAGGGSIEVATEAEVGTTFTVRLPQVGGQHLPTPPALPERVRLPPGLRLLVVDDEVLIGRLIRTGLTEADVVAVSSGRAALDLLDEGAEFDVILSDLMMPEVTGMELHAVLCERDPGLADRMVFMTGGAFTAGDRAFLEQVEDRSIAKPFTMDDLRVALRRRLPA